MNIIQNKSHYSINEITKYIQYSRNTITKFDCKRKNKSNKRFYENVVFILNNNLL